MHMKIRILALAVFACSGILVTSGTLGAQPTPGNSSAMATASLKQFLRTLDNGYDKQARYIVAFRDLNGDGVSEAIVYIVGPRSCGSGGCDTYVLTPRTNSWKVMGHIGISYPPIYVLSDVSKGWHSFGVLTRDMRTNTDNEVELKFNGKSYPRYPYTPPGKRLEGTPVGEVVIAAPKLGTALDGTPLYDN